MFVRTDIPVADQIVPAGHACLEAGSRFGLPETENYLIVLEAESQEHLREIQERLDLAGVRSTMFFEPDDGKGHTALCTEPLGEENRRLFRRCHLWGSKVRRSSRSRVDDGEENIPVM